MTTSTPYTALASGAPVQEHTKRRLLVLSRSLEARVHQAGPGSLVLATFQYAANMTPRSTGIYAVLAELGHQVATYAVGPTSRLGAIEQVALSADDPVTREWNVIVVGRHASYALAGQEVDPVPGQETPADLERRFRWTVSEQRDAVVHAAHLLLQRGPQRTWQLPAAA